MFDFKPLSPEQAGLPSKAIIAVLEQFKKLELPLHSLLIARHNRLIYEGYHSPYDQDTLHRMFSISKSFTAMAIGILAYQRKLSLKDPIAAYFPEYTNDDTHPWILNMTIRDLLTMRTCHAATTYKAHPDEDWVGSFFTTVPTHPAGRIFHYDTSASHTLAALAEKLSKKPLLDFLKTECLREAGFSEHSYIKKDPFGVSMGGSGLMALPRDLLIFGSLLNSNGMLNGRRWIGTGYLTQMQQLTAATRVTASCLSEAQGYGYQTWRNEKNGAVCYGMGGQLLILLPEYDLICVTTADTQGVSGGNQALYHTLYDYLLPVLQAEPLTEDSQAQFTLQQMSQSLTLPSVQKEAAAPESFQSGLVYQLQPNPIGFLTVCLDLEQQHRTGVLSFSLPDEKLVIPFGIDRHCLFSFPRYQQKCAVSGNWLADQSFYLNCQFIDEEIGSLHIQLSFGEQDVAIFTRKQAENLLAEFDSQHFYGIAKEPPGTYGQSPSGNSTAKL